MSSIVQEVGIHQCLSNLFSEGLEFRNPTSANHMEVGVEPPLESRLPALVANYNDTFWKTIGARIDSFLDFWNDSEFDKSNCIL